MAPPIDPLPLCAVPIVLIPDGFFEEEALIALLNSEALLSLGEGTRLNFFILLAFGMLNCEVVLLAKWGEFNESDGLCWELVK